MRVNWRSVLLLCFACAAMWWMVVPAPIAPSSRDGSYQPMRWEDLVPKGWDPTNSFRAIPLDRLRDADPRAQELIAQMRKAWDNAPTLYTLDGTLLEIAGYVVPLEGTADGVREFLLVPYFGACIHSPPPPANQLVLAVLDKPAANLKTMDVVRIAGRMTAQRHPSVLGVSGYSMRVDHLARIPQN